MSKRPKLDNTIKKVEKLSNILLILLAAVSVFITNLASKVKDKKTIFISFAIILASNMLVAIKTMDLSNKVKHEQFKEIVLTQRRI